MSRAPKKPKPQPKKPRKPRAQQRVAAVYRLPTPLMRELLNTLDRGAWIMIKDKLGPRRAAFARVTRDGKGNDVMVDIPRGSDFVRVVIPIKDVLALVKPGDPGDDINIGHWRKLAADAIKAVRDLADVDDDIRDIAIQLHVELERRMLVLSGQQELFT